MDLYLPNEILFQILIRLPVKALVRFRCVSKFWYSRIGKSKFMLSHLHHNQVANSNVLFRKYLSDCKTEIYSLHSDNQEFQEIETLDFPFKCADNYFSIIGCVNGLICLWDKISTALVFWNPSIRKYVTLPKFSLEPAMKMNKRMRLHWNPTVVRDMCFGFGYDALSNDYKAIRMIFYEETDELGNDAVKCSVSVFTLLRRSWRSLDYNAPLRMYSRSCNVGGFVYRLTTVIGDNRLEIVSFDLSTEVFTEMACPDEVRFVARCTPELTIYCDSLALLHEWDYKRYHIWVMKEDDGAKSWMKLFSVDLDGGVSGQRIVGFSMKGLMLVVGEGNLLVSPAEKDAQVVKYVPHVPQSAWHVESYQGSLVLLKEPNRE
ncbi:hypothetical protein SOVF_112700 [Spinacia oleracea]|uniref:F-box protein CPR1 n=1 Tax=Spinacia oleracea TaxID=3562 RepID=A0A9R0IUG9_SPIOL|nr:F-box protein CPR1-like [Spinacia oleracea]KNA13873.1 hypothetical protein SOVF_112700 [Spinacia oleracea]